MTSLRSSELVVLAWCAIAALVGLWRPLPWRRRVTVVAGSLFLASGVLIVAVLPASVAASISRNLAPAVWVLAAYWIAAAFFVSPCTDLEAWLVTVDRHLLGPLQLDRWVSRAPLWVVEAVEVAYLAVYAMLPLGVAAAWSAGGDAAVDRYWLVVFPAEALCYLALAWLPTRPPRVLEPWTGRLRVRSAFRRTNEFVLRHGSHCMNTLPSGHAAGAVAVVLALTSLGTSAAVLFAMVAAAILLATIVGRYHFVVDTVTGSLVAAVWWSAVRLWG